MVEFRLPSLGAEMESAKLLEWRVKPGDIVKRGSIVALVDTDKAAIEVECWQEGVVDKLLIDVGMKVSVGTPILVLNEKSATPPIEKKAERQRISPLARNRALEMNVDVAKLKGTGPEGSITEADVMKAAGQGHRERPAEISAMRQTIAAAMARSKREIPHYYLAHTIPIVTTLHWLENENRKRSITARILFAALLIKAVARACKKYPQFNGFWKNDRLEIAPSVNVGMAISLKEHGLIAPAILNCAGMNLDQVMESLRDLTTRARAGSLKSSEISSATITITNLGDLGVDQVFGVIYPPQVALVGFGKISDTHTITATLSGDHRATDGSLGALFLSKIGECLREPERLLDHE